MEFRFSKHVLEFYRPAKTSRNVMTEKPSWFIQLRDPETGITGIGECSIIPGLSLENEQDIESCLAAIKQDIEKSGIKEIQVDLTNFPAVRFGLETAIRDYQNGGRRVIFDSPFASGAGRIPINGLVWMSGRDEMKQQIREKIEGGYTCIKLKVGALDFEDELNLVKFIREEYPPELEIRLDANGAWDFETAGRNLDILSRHRIHSIEQPLPVGKWEQMAALCSVSPVAIALDEELIGVCEKQLKKELLETIRPAYIILKPSLTGGFEACDEWIQMAQKIQAGWWATSALESNIGLNAIAQWVSTYKPDMPQGLGTGMLYRNNFDSPLKAEDGHLSMDRKKEWKLTKLS